MRRLLKSQSGIAPIAIIVAIVVVLAIGGVAYYVAGTDDTGTDSNNDQSSQSNDEPSTESFDATATTGLSFEANMNGTTADGEAYSAVILHDGNGNIKSTTDADGETVEAYIFNDGTFITCSEAGCFELSGGESQVRTDYDYSQEEFDSFKEMANYIGQENCPAGTCAVWQVDDNDTNTDTRVYLASDKRVSKLTTQNESGQFEITYQYKDVTIKRPANVQKFSS